MSVEMMKLITAQAGRMDPGTGGRPDITEEDISHAMGRLGEKGKGAALLLRIRVAGQRQFLPDLFVMLFLEIYESKGKRWRKVRDHWVWDMCHLAVDDYCAPEICTTCNGRKSAKVGLSTIPCSSCNGTGRYRLSAPHEYMGCTEAQWEDWRHEYSMILSKLSEWDSDGRGALGAIENED